jgi:hypothetical protein
MDPITALGVAGSIVQLVDFGTKVVSKGHKIYHSADGLDESNHDLEVVTNDLILLQARLICPLATKELGVTLSGSDRALLHLSKASFDVASDLLMHLNKIKVQGKRRRWKSFRQALKTVCSKGEIEAMAKRVSALREQLQTRILVDIR